MNQIVNTLISALGIALRDQAGNDLHPFQSTPMVELDAKHLVQIVGGDDDGPRTGWKDASSASPTA
jgi:hypothetical protein